MNNSFNFKIFLLFIFQIISLFVSIIINIPGDEPDYYIRLSDLVEKYYFLDFFGIYNLIFRLNYSFDTTFNPLQDFSVPIEPVYQFIIAKLYNGFIILLLINCLIYYLNNIKVYLARNLLILLCFMPSFYYYYTLLSPEFIFNIIAILFVVSFFLRRYVLSFIFLFILNYIDTGNSYVVILFILIFFILRFLISIFGELSALIIIALPPIFFCFFRDHFFIYLNQILPDNSYIMSLSNKILYDSSTSKYSIFLRYLTTLWSLYDLKPSGLNSLPIFVFFLMYYLIAVIIYYKDTFCNDKIYFISSILTIIYIDSLLPSYAFGKYFVFLLPILMLPLANFFSLSVLFLAISLFAHFLVVLLIRIF